MNVAVLSLALFAMARQDKADVVYRNGNVYPVSRGRCEALAVRRGRILAVGSDRDMEGVSGPRTRIVDLEGRTVTPGLIDAHGHMGSLGALLTGSIDLRSTRSFAELIRIIRDRAIRLRPGEWIVGGRWDQANWNQKEFPTHHRLSAVTPHHPVLLYRVDGHAALANRKAMESAGITSRTKDPDGGKMLRDGRGEPTGLFVDHAMDLFRGLLPRRKGARDRLLAAQDRCLSLGLTGVHDAGITPEEVGTYRKLEAEGKLKLRVYAMIAGGRRVEDYLESHPPVVGERLTVRAVKMMMDGAMGSRGAWLLEDYSDKPGHRGLALTDSAVLERVARIALRRGYQVCTHAIGDRAVRETLNAYRRAFAAAPKRDRRFRVEHAQNPARSDIPLFARLGVIPSMQPTHATSDMRWARDRVGPERIKGAYAWASFLKSGSRIAAGSDFPVESADPLLGIYAAVTRQDREGRPPGGWRAEERLTREQALRAFTLDAAYAAFEEGEKGSLDPGKVADFVSWSADIMTCPPRDLLRIRAVATFVGGVKVFARK